MGDGIPLSGLLLIISIIINYILRLSKVAFEYANISNIKKNTEKEEKINDKIVNLIKHNTKLLYTFDVLFIILHIGFGIIFFELLNNYNVIYSVIVFFIILLGTILPKKLGIRRADKIVYKVQKVVSFFCIVLTPLTWLMDKAMKGIFRIIGINPAELEENVTEEEIISMVHEGKEQGVFEESEVEMISNIIELNDKEAQDIMTHKKKVTMINVDENLKDALELMLEEGFSRYPLYEDTKDNVVGVLHLKDVFTKYLAGDYLNIKLKDIAREAFFVPDTQNISVLFHEMQSRNIHMAIAIDEYGQTAGIVAMEDIIEEIVGNIWDEYDTEEKMILNKGKDTFIVLGAIHLDELEEELDIDFETEDYDTLNGLLISLLDRIPQDGEKAIVDFKGYRFHVLSTGNRMIEKVKISKNHKE